MGQERFQGLENGVMVQEGQGLLLQVVQVGCTCRLLPSDGSWVGCKEGLGERLVGFHAATAMGRLQLGVPQPENTLGKPPSELQRWTFQS